MQDFYNHFVSFYSKIGHIFHFLISMRWLLTLEEQRGHFLYLSLISLVTYQDEKSSKDEGHLRL